MQGRRKKPLSRASRGLFPEVERQIQIPSPLQGRGNKRAKQRNPYVKTPEVEV